MLLADVLNEHSTVEIGFVILIAGGFVGGIWKVVSSLSSLDHRIDLLQQAMELRFQRLEIHAQDDTRLTRAEFRAWVHEFVAANPTLKIPSPDIDSPRRKD